MSKCLSLVGEKYDSGKVYIEAVNMQSGTMCVYGPLIGNLQITYLSLRDSGDGEQFGRWVERDEEMWYMYQPDGSRLYYTDIIAFTPRVAKEE